MSELRKEEVLVVKLGEALATKHFEELLAAGLAMRNVLTLSEACEIVKGAVDDIVLVDCGSEEEETLANVRKIIDCQLIHSNPVIVVGKEVDSYETIMGRYLGLSFALPLPVNIPQLIETVHWCRKRRQSTERVSTAIEVPSEAENLYQAVHRLYQEVNSIPELLFKQLDGYELPNCQIDPMEFLKTPDEEAVFKENLPKVDPVYAAALSSRCPQLGRWGYKHALRVVRYTYNFCKYLAAPAEHTADAMTSAAMVFNSIRNSDRDLLRRDYFGSRGLILRKDLSSRIKDAAMTIAVDMGGRSTVAQIVSEAAKQLGRESSPQDNWQSLLASVIVAADLISRFAFGKGVYDPRGLFSLLRRLKAGKIKELHPRVLALCVRVVAEMVCASPKLLLTKAIRENLTSVSSQFAQATQTLSEKERRVRLEELTPGMRLSRPLIAYDGQSLINEDLILDEDLIWRIWQLSAIRPILNPAIVIDKRRAH